MRFSDALLQIQSLDLLKSPTFHHLEIVNLALTRGRVFLHIKNSLKLDRLETMIALVAPLRYFTLVLLLTFAFMRGDSFAFSQGRLTGRITDGGGQPLGAATVFLSSPTAAQAAITNAQGYYVFLSVAPGSYTIKVSKRGQPAAEPRSVAVASNLMTRLDVALGGRAVAVADKKEKKEDKPKELADAEKSASTAAAPTPQPISTPQADEEQLRKVAEEAKALEEFVNTAPEKEIAVDGGMGAVMKKVVYPETAKNLKIEGKVVARVYISPAGEVMKIDLIKSAHELLNEEAVRVLSEEVAYTPAQLNGKVVPGAITIPINFKLGKVEW